jgi:prophage regulatory protein
MTLIDYRGLTNKGIKFSDVHIRRLVVAGEFPAPIKIGKRDHWVESEIDKYIETKLAQRDGVAA